MTIKVSLNIILLFLHFFNVLNYLNKYIEIKNAPFVNLNNAKFAIESPSKLTVLAPLYSKLPHLIVDLVPLRCPSSRSLWMRGSTVHCLKTSLPLNKRTTNLRTMLAFLLEGWYIRFYALSSRF